MFLLRRTAFKALATPTVSCLVKSSRPLSSATATPSIIKTHRKWIAPLQCHRFYASTDTSEVAAPSEESVTDETVTELPSTEDKQQFGVPSGPESVEKSPHVVYVGNLFFEVSEAQLRTVFAPFGEIENLRVVVDNRGLSRGFGFVTFVKEEDAEEAIQNLNQQVFEGRRLILQKHVPRSRTRASSTPLVMREPTKTLFIGNMSFEMSDKDLNDLFREIRNVLDVRVAIDRRTGQPRGFAHADFIDLESAKKAKEVLETKSFYGRQLRIDYSDQPTRARRTEFAADQL